MNRVILLDAPASSGVIDALLAEYPLIRTIGWQEDTEVPDTDVVAWFMDRPSPTACFNLRNRLGFAPVVVIVFCANPGQWAGELLVMGADRVEPFPDTVGRLKDILAEEKRNAALMKNLAKDNLEPFAEPVLEIFRTMAYLEAERIDHYRVTGRFHYGEITAIMTLSGACKGNLQLTMDTALARVIVSAIMGMEPDALTEEDIQDGVGEMLNMIAGGAKSRTGGLFDLTAPTVIAGHRYRVISGHDLPRVAIVYESVGKRFALIVASGWLDR